MPGMADLGRLESSTGAVSQRPVPGIIERWPGITARLHSSMQQPNSGGSGTDATTGFSEDSSKHRQTALRLRMFFEAVLPIAAPLAALGIMLSLLAFS